jgi:hypothetical protein
VTRPSYGEFPRGFQCRNAARVLIDAAISAMDKIEEVLLDCDRIGPPPLESLTADIDPTPENIQWFVELTHWLQFGLACCEGALRCLWIPCRYGENISLAYRRATGAAPPVTLPRIAGLFFAVLLSTRLFS